MRQARRTKFGHRTKKLYGNKRTCGYEPWLARVWADSRLAGAPDANVTSRIYSHLLLDAGKQRREALDAA
jgi:hypothetical protein